MKKTILSLLLVFACNFLFGIDYYISNSGNDANNGTSPTTAWASINKLNASWASIVSGDRILFERGGTFFGTITVSKGGVTLGAYGTGNLPVITGFKTLTGWVNTGTNLWTTNLGTPKSYLNVLTINAQLAREGRFPDWNDNAASWLTYTNSIPTTSPVTVNSSTTPPTNFVGGELVLRKESYIMDIMPITAQVGNSFTCINPAGLYGIQPSLSNYGYFIQGHPATLTTANEWYFNPTTKDLTIFSTTSPTSTIRGSVFDTLVNVTQSNVTIENLDIQGSNRFGVISNGGNFILRNSIVRFIGYWGVFTNGASTSILNNIIRDIGSNAIWITNTGGLVQGNQIKNVYTIDGMGGSGGDQGFGVALEGNSITCRNNIVDSMGYMGIKIGGGTNGSNILIRENVVSNVCMNKNDGGAIYSYGANGQWNATNRVIKRNILINNGKIIYGVAGGTLSTAHFPMYTDGSSGNIIIDSNVIAYDNLGQNAVSPDPIGREDDPAILMNNPRNITLTNNITFGFPKSLLVCDWAPSIAGTPKPTGNTIKNNALYVNSMPNGTFSQQVNESFFWISQGSVGVTQMQTDMRNMGVMDSNIVSDHTQAPFHWTSYTTDGAFPVKLAAWRTFSGKDLNSTSFPSTTPDFQVNTTSSPITYSFPGLSKIDFRGVVYNNSAVIPAYYANIFFPNGSAPSGNAPVVTATATTITCNGGSSTVTVSATGGTPPYTGTGTFTRTAGTYTFTVTDAANVSGSTTITINQPSALTAGDPTAPAITTAGGTTTITQPVPTGGTAPFQYQLGTGVFQGTNTFSGVVAGTYTITIRDACSTTITKSITIAPFTAPAYVAKIISVNFGTTTWAQNETRTVQVTVQNVGSATWTDGSGTTRDINVGIKWNGWSDYHSRTDAHPCAPGETRTYTLSIRAANATQSASGTGNINNVTPVYSTPLALGTNNLTIDLVNERACWFANNSGGCGPGNTRFVTPAITIVAPTSPLVVTATQTTAIACNGGTATIVVSATGGTPPYTGTGTFTRTAGTQTFTVTDAAGVISSSTLTITEPTVLSVTATATPVTCVGGSSTITIGATGGTPPYTGVGTFTRTAGTHTFVVTDANGCSVTTTVTINDPQVVAPIVNIGSVVSPGTPLRINNPVIIQQTAKPNIQVVIFPNPTLDRFELRVNTTSKENVTVLVTDLEGKLLFQSTGAYDKKFFFGRNFISGIYMVKVVQGKKTVTVKVVKG